MEPKGRRHTMLQIISDFSLVWYPPLHSRNQCRYHNVHVFVSNCACGFRFSLLQRVHARVVERDVCTRECPAE